MSSSLATIIAIITISVVFWESVRAPRAAAPRGRPIRDDLIIPVQLEFLSLPPLYADGPSPVSTATGDSVLARV